MPNPKRRHSKRRTSNRRAHHFLNKPATGECPNCHEMKQPHQVCPHWATTKAERFKKSQPSTAWPAGQQPFQRYFSGLHGRAP